jgi:hypothetical protein
MSPLDVARSSQDSGAHMCATLTAGTLVCWGLLLRQQKTDDARLPWDVLMSTGTKRPLDEDAFAELLDYLVG